VGRLFWKFFIFIWLAQITAMLGVGGALWLEHHAGGAEAALVDTSPPAVFVVRSAATTLRDGGTMALRRLISDPRHPVFAVDEHGHELLGRDVSPIVLAEARHLHEADARAVREVSVAGEATYILYVPATRRGPDGRGDAPTPGDGPPPSPPDAPPGEEAFFPLPPMIAAFVVSLVFAALLAWYFSKPIRQLRSAFEAAAAGDLNRRLGPEMGQRRDELADLGRHYDRMAERLRAVLEGQRRLLHDVSHELRSPFARLQAAVGLVRQQPDKLEASMVRIERETMRMDRLIGELLTLSRVEAGAAGALDEEIDMADLVGTIVEDARFEAEANGRSVLALGDCSATVIGRGEWLHRALENVVRNAVKYAPEGGGVEVRSHVDDRERRLYVEILDDGPGVRESELSAIFEPFYRGLGASTTDGHGLGLAIARRVVEAHGGTIRASNRDGGGLSVEIALPIMSNVPG
jgi:two-component system OmpR family sensor kinase